MFKSKKVRVSLAIAIIAIVAVGVFHWRDLYALAQSVIDSFANETMVADTWNATVDTGAGELKQSEKSCNGTDWFCAENTVCADTLGDGNHIIVAQTDAPTTKQWKTEETDCHQPQCGAGNYLRADNTISFTDYPARDYCKSIGGRLPTKDELNCIYNNQASFGSGFTTGDYWSSTEYSITYACIQSLSTGGQSIGGKLGSLHVRCVLGW